MRCTTTWVDSTSDHLDIAVPILRDSTEILADRLFVGHDNLKQWTLQIADIPNAGKNQACCAQNIYESTLVHHHTKVKEAPKPPKEVDAMEVVKDEPLEVKSEDNAPKEKEEQEKEDPVKKEDGKDEEIKLEDVVDVKMEDVVDVKIEETVDLKVEEPIPESKDSFLQFVEDLGYDVINQYWVSGIRFFQGDIIIEIYKIFVRDDSPSSNKDKIKLKLLDESNTFQIKTYINCPKSTDVEFVNQGTKDLLRLQEFFKNLFVLEVPDRMFMDSRINRQS